MTFKILAAILFPLAVVVYGTIRDVQSRRRNRQRWKEFWEGAYEQEG